MASAQKVLISLESNDNDPIVSRREVELLQRNLRTAGINALPHHINNLPPQTDWERRGDTISLYTLGMTFLTSGAAVAVVNALRATFAAAHSGSIKFKVILPDRTIEISGDHLNGDRAEKLIQVLRRELEHEG
jgi:hypothetical protein